MKLPVDVVSCLFLFLLLIKQNAVSVSMKGYMQVIALSSSNLLRIINNLEFISDVGTTK